MIPENALREAAEAAACAINNSLPALEMCDHQFSMRFEEKMRGLLRRERHPIFFRSMRIAACIALIAALMFGSLISVNAEVREAVLSWFRQSLGEISVYFTPADGKDVEILEDGAVIVTEEEQLAEQSQAVEYQLGWMPENFELDPISGAGMMLYRGTNDRRLIFQYSSPSSGETVVVDAEDASVTQEEVNGVMADLYLEEDINRLSAIFWTDPETEYLLSITGNLTKEELLRMAESVSILQ